MTSGPIVEDHADREFQIRDHWVTSRRRLPLGKTLVMAILNATPDSFSDGGEAFTIDDALHRTERCISEGADILDIGGESTRPGSVRVSEDEEVRRVVPVIEAIVKRFDVPVSVDTSKAVVAEKALAAGAEIVNDISALRFDERIGEVAARAKAGLVLMHSRGHFEDMHSQPPLAEIFPDVVTVLGQAVKKAINTGVAADSIVLDAGIGFGKTPEQNLELLARLDKLTTELGGFPMLVGTSRKSFIGKILNDAPARERLSGSLATAAIAVWNGASIVRVHDVKDTVGAVRVVEAIRGHL